MEAGYDKSKAVPYSKQPILYFSFNAKIIAEIAPYVQVLEVYVALAINLTKWKVIVFGESKTTKQRMKKLFF